MEAFHAIENILHFHHATSRQPLRVSQLRLRCFQNGCQVSKNDINVILRVWPEAYNVYTSRGSLVIEALDLPQNVDQRRAEFAKKWAEKENAINAPPKELIGEKANCLGDNDKGLKREPLMHIQKPILMGRLAKPQPTNKSLNLLDRIRAKEAALKRARTPEALQRNRDSFLRSQIPKLKRILDGLTETSGSRSLDMQEMMDIIRTNMSKLGDDEIKRALQLIIQQYPSFCSMITVGSTTHIKLQKSSSIICS